MQSRCGRGSARGLAVESILVNTPPLVTHTRPSLHRDHRDHKDTTRYTDATADALARAVAAAVANVERPRIACVSAPTLYRLV